MLIGYAQLRPGLCTGFRTPRSSLMPSRAPDCEKTFTEKASGAQRDRPEFKAALEFVHKSDTLLVWKLDRLARSIRQLIETIENLEKRGIGFRSLIHIFAGLAEFER